MSYSEWAYSEPQEIPAELVSRDSKAIDTLVVRDGGARHGNGTYKNSTAGQLNEWPVYPVIRTADPHNSNDIPGTPVES